MESFNSTDGWYEGRPVASGSTPQNRSSARSSPPTKTSITRTGLSSQTQSSRHSGNNVLCPRSIPSTKRFIRSLRKSRRNHTARITSTRAFLHSQDQHRHRELRAELPQRVEGGVCERPEWIDGRHYPSS